MLDLRSRRREALYRDRGEKRMPTMALIKRITTVIVIWTSATAIAFAQGAAPFAGFKHDSSEPIEIAADQLEVFNNQNKAIFTGNVEVQQGVTRLKAQELHVTYRQRGEGDASGQTGTIKRLQASGDVMMSNGKERAQANEADYDVSKGIIILTGDVLLMQGENAINSNQLVIDLVTGKATMQSDQSAASGSGRVRVKIAPNRNQN
jgi:lipopolysaccharide export system protein LptA